VAGREGPGTTYTPPPRLRRSGPGPTARRRSSHASISAGGEPPAPSAWPRRYPSRPCTGPALRRRRRRSRLVGDPPPEQPGQLRGASTRQRSGRSAPRQPVSRRRAPRRSVPRIPLARAAITLAVTRASQSARWSTASLNSGNRTLANMLTSSATRQGSLTTPLLSRYLDALGCHPHPPEKR